MIAVQEQEQRREHRTNHRAGVIHRAVEPIHLAAGAWCRPQGQHRVTRCAANSLANAIQHANREHLQPRSGERDERHRQHVDDAGDQVQQSQRHAGQHDQRRPDQRAECQRDAGADNR